MLVESGWTSCVNDTGGLHTVLAEQSAGRPLRNQALLVRDNEHNQPYLIAGSRRYALPKDANRSPEVRALHLDGEPVHTLPARWVGLFESGSKVEPFRVPGAGQTIQTGVPELSRIGMRVTVDQQPYVLVRDRAGKPALLRLSRFADAVYQSRGPGARPPLVLRLGDVQNLDSLTNATLRTYPEDWPTNELTGTAQTCAVLVGTGSDVRRTYLASVTANSALPSGGDSSVTVQAGRGALVRGSSGGAPSPTVFLVDATGTRYAVGGTGDSTEAQKRLGYGKVSVPAVPTSWITLFSSGPELTIQAAQNTPGSPS